jgi:hypothetical protein
MMARLQAMPHKSLLATIFLACCALFYFTFLVTGYFVVQDGMGWDGRTFVWAIEAASKGMAYAASPYHTIRMGAFLPVIAFNAIFGLSEPQMVHAQTVVNALLLAASATAFFDFLTRMGVRRGAALLSLATLVFSWPFLVMPMYYPVLSDPMALAVACLSCWLWERRKSGWLVLLTAYSPFVVAGLFVVPLVLAALPRSRSGGVYVGKDARALRYLALLAGAAVSVWLFRQLMHMPDERILAPGGGVQPGIAAWHGLSAAIGGVLVLFCVYLAAGIGIKAYRSRCVSWVGLVAAVLAAGVSTVVILRYLLGNPGFRGPPLLDNIFLQTVVLPFAPTVAHFLYFGGPFLLACAALWRYARNTRTDALPFFVLAAIFLPILALGSESRQWLEVFPILVACVALTPMSNAVRGLAVAAALLLCVPALWLAGAITDPAPALADFSTGAWQLYFGRQGPWMAFATYRIGLCVVAGFIALGWLAGRRYPALAAESTQTRR